MPAKLKDILIPDAQILKLTTSIQTIYPEFEAEEFIRLVLDSQWPERELKQKMRHITICLKLSLPDDYPKAINILERIASQYKGFIALSFSDFAECYGQESWDISMNALAHFTSSCTSEFAVRPFLNKDPLRAMEYLYRWAESQNQHVRRLASEGCRPRLPWGMGLPKFKKDPGLIIPVLEKLKHDPDKYVRKSVANNLNDISKDHPELVLELLEKWKGDHPETDQIIKHACRTMLKAGNKRALMLFGFAHPSKLKVIHLMTDKQRLSIGENLSFSFTFANDSGEVQFVRLEYRIHYVKSKGKTSAKIFQICEKSFTPGEHLICKNQSFTDLTTRTHYPGEHSLEIVVNGELKSETKIWLER